MVSAEFDEVYRTMPRGTINKQLECALLWSNWSWIRYILLRKTPMTDVALREVGSP